MEVLIPGAISEGAEQLFAQENMQGNKYKQKIAHVHTNTQREAAEEPESETKLVIDWLSERHHSSTAEWHNARGGINPEEKERGERV